MEIEVASFTIHENYDFLTDDNDIAIIELAEEVDLIIYTPACLAKTSDTTTFDGKNAWVYGEIKLLSSCSSGNNHLSKVGGQHPLGEIYLRCCWRSRSLW